MSWRTSCREIIARTIAANKHDPEALKKALFEAYPFGPRQYHPYKIWLDEIKRQTGKKVTPRRGEPGKDRPSLPGQGSLFEPPSSQPPA